MPLLLLSRYSSSSGENFCTANFYVSSIFQKPPRINNTFVRTTNNPFITNLNGFSFELIFKQNFGEPSRGNLALRPWAVSFSLLSFFPVSNSEHAILPQKQIIKALHRQFFVSAAALHWLKVCKTSANDPPIMSWETYHIDPFPSSSLMNKHVPTQKTDSSRLSSPRWG